MGTYYGLEIVAGIDRQIFFCDKGLPPTEFLTLFRPCDRAYPEFPSGFEDSDEPYIPSHAYLVTGEDGSLMPVQWRGYESKLKRYQGELLDKKSVQQRFLNALNASESLDEANLASTRAVLQMIFTAFS